jgi:hypothetical protein
MMLFVLKILCTFGEIISSLWQQCFDETHLFIYLFIFLRRTTLDPKMEVHHLIIIFNNIFLHGKKLVARFMP